MDNSSICVTIGITIFFLVANLPPVAFCVCECNEDNRTLIYGKMAVYCTCEQSVKRFIHIADKKTLVFLTLKKFTEETLSAEYLADMEETVFDMQIKEFCQLKRIEPNTFNEFSQLTSLFVSLAPMLTTLSLDILQNGGNKLNYLSITKSGLRQPPLIRLAKSILTAIDFEGNAIQNVRSNNIAAKANRIILDYNKISNIEAWAFNNSEISEVSLRGNRELKILTEEAFYGLSSLTILDLSETSIRNIPSSGLKELEVLIMQSTYTLQIIPTIHEFPNLTKADLTFSFHCCAFHLPARHEPKRHALYEAYHERLKKHCEEQGSNNNRSSRDHTPINDDTTDNPDEWFDIITASPSTMINSDSFHQSSSTLRSDNLFSVSCDKIRYKRKPVKCEPAPNAFNPCEDIMGYDWLRFSVWFVILIGLFGNACVLAVILSKPAEITVPNFLIMNLAFSDLCTVVFLLLLGVEDLISEGYYFNYAYDWQRGIGCKLAGFLTIFSTLLSIFLLCLLTVERWFTIKKALYLNKLTFRKTVLITVCGWVYALIMGALPLIGISSYSTTSLCLPMDIDTVPGIAYVLLLLFSAAVGFALICICYFQIYFSLSYETRHKDGEYVLARKMIILVGTNFLCLAPITFFGFSAVLGYPLIDITRSKILLVFFYPLNACANPFLYAILTKNFKKNSIILLSKFGLCEAVRLNYARIYYRPKSKTKVQILRPTTSQTAL